MKESARLPVLEMLPDGSYRSVLVASRITGRKRDALIAAARRGGDLEEDQARHVRVIEYDVPDREGDGKDELIVLVTTITDFGRWLGDYRCSLGLWFQPHHHKGESSSYKREHLKGSRRCSRRPTLG